jgi:hypothetical protein
MLTTAVKGTSAFMLVAGTPGNLQEISIITTQHIGRLHPRYFLIVRKLEDELIDYTIYTNSATDQI